MSMFTKLVEMRTLDVVAQVNSTAEAEAGLRASGLSEGTVTIFCRHTSCSLVIMENADPSAQADLERSMERPFPENDPRYTHTLDSPMICPVTSVCFNSTSEVIPFIDGRLCLGTWCGHFSLGTPGTTASP